ncbi:MAG: hypothetical protein JXR73_14150, partial [Candidatus Omnitrophica bacterium]|nr:hypothetical protein [Candidatus Omnitrophota bacterium]
MNVLKTQTVLFLLTAILCCFTFAGKAEAAAGVDSTDFVASEPSSYLHYEGGGSYNDRTIGYDVVESLEGGDFGCFEKVTHLLYIRTDDTYDPDLDPPIDITVAFTAFSTGQQGVAYIKFARDWENPGLVLVAPNYGPQENGGASAIDENGDPLPGTYDIGINDDYQYFDGNFVNVVESKSAKRADSYLVRSYIKTKKGNEIEWFNINTPYEAITDPTDLDYDPDLDPNNFLYIKGNYLMGDIRIENMQPSSELIVTMSVILGCDPNNGSPTGNLQGSIDKIMVGTDKVPIGAQTVPLKGVDNVGHLLVSCQDHVLPGCNLDILDKVHEDDYYYDSSDPDKTYEELFEELLRATIINECDYFDPLHPIYHVEITYEEGDWSDPDASCMQTKTITWSVTNNCLMTATCDQTLA